MAWTQTQLDAIEAAIAKGVRSVTYDGQSVTYGSLSEMLRVRDLMRKSLGIAGNSQRRYAGFSRGL